MPSSVLPTMASVEELTMAARNARRPCSLLAKLEMPAPPAPRCSPARCRFSIAGTIAASARGRYGQVPAPPGWPRGVGGLAVCGVARDFDYVLRDSGAGPNMGLFVAVNLARPQRLIQRGSMERNCEVCESLPQAISPQRTILEVKLDKRTVTLCRGHARIAMNSGVTDFEGLRALYGSGRRSHVPRRDPRVVMTSGDQRQSAGRRARDRV